VTTVKLRWELGRVASYDHIDILYDYGSFDGRSNVIRAATINPKDV